MFSPQLKKDIITWLHSKVPNFLTLLKGRTFDCIKMNKFSGDKLKVTHIMKLEYDRVKNFG